MQSNNKQLKFLEKNYEPEFIDNNHQTIFYDAEENYISEDDYKKIYIFSSSQYAKPLFNRRDHGVEHVYYTLKRSDQLINNKPVYLPFQVFSQGAISCKKSKKLNAMDSFNIENFNIKKLYNQQYNKKTAFQYMNGPLKNEIVSSNIEIIHFSVKTKASKYFINISIEKNDHIEIHPIQVKSMDMVKKQQKTFQRHRQDQYKNFIIEKNQESKEKRELQRLEIAAIRTMTFFSTPHFPRPILQPIADIKEDIKKEVEEPIFQEKQEENTKIFTFNQKRVKFIFNEENHYRQIREDFKKREQDNNKRKLEEDNHSIKIISDSWIGINEKLKKIKKK